MSANILWKPVSERDGNLVVLFPYDVGNVRIVDAQGRVLSTGQNLGASNGRRATVRFNNPGGSYNNVYLEDGRGNRFPVKSGADRAEGSQLTPEGGFAQGTASSGAAVPDSYQSDGSFVTADGQTASSAIGQFNTLPGGLAIIPRTLKPRRIRAAFQDTFLDEEAATVNPVETETAEFVDPFEVGDKTSTFNREQTGINFNISRDRAKQLNEDDTNAILDFNSRVAPAIREGVATDNEFNQDQRISNFDKAVPGGRKSFENRRARAEVLASGRFFSDIEDTAFELANRSNSADASFSVGVGNNSLVARTASDLLSAQQRLQVAQIGENTLSNALSQEAELLFDVPIRANTTEGLPTAPRFDVSQLTTQQQSSLDARTTLDPLATTSTVANQNQFNTNTVNQGRQFNAQVEEGNITRQIERDIYNNNRKIEVETQVLNQIIANRGAKNQADQLSVDSLNAFYVDDFNRRIIADEEAEKDSEADANAAAQAQAMVDNLDELVAEGAITQDQADLFRDTFDDILGA